MGRRERKAAERWARVRRQTGATESGNEECFAATWGRPWGIQSGPLEAAAPVVPVAETALDRARAKVASYEAKDWLTEADRDQLDFYRGLVAKFEREAQAS